MVRRSYCHHCGYEGRHDKANSNNFNKRRRVSWKKLIGRLTRKYHLQRALPDEVVKFFEKRKISKEVLKRNKICFKNNEILFPYFKNGEIVNIKYRTLRQEIQTGNWMLKKYSTVLERYYKANEESSYCRRRN